MSLQNQFKKQIAEFLKISVDDIAKIDWRWDGTTNAKADTIYVEFYEGFDITWRYIKDGKAWK